MCFCLCPAGASADSERAAAGGAFGEHVSRKHRAEGKFGLFTGASGTARPTQPAAHPTGNTLFKSLTQLC